MLDSTVYEKINAKTIDLKRYGKNIRLLREAEGFTLQEVSEALGYNSPSIVAKWEKGMTRPPVESVAKLALLYGVSTDYLLTETLEDNNKKALYTKALDPIYNYDHIGNRVKYCPCCKKPLDKNGNDGRFCKYCGQEIAGKEDYGKEVAPVKDKKKSGFKWGWY